MAQARKKTAARRTRARTKMPDLLREQLSEILERWINSTIALSGRRILDLMPRKALAAEAMVLGEAMIEAFRTESLEDLEQPAFTRSLRRRSQDQASHSSLRCV